MSRLKLIADKTELMSNGFRKISPTEYVCSFPCYKYRKQTIIQGNAIADIENEYVIIEVINLNTNSFYYPYYNNEYSSKNLVLKEVYNNVNKKIEELHRLHIIANRKK